MPRKPRIEIPENAGELLKLSASVYAQHQKLAAKSPLNALEEGPTWADAGGSVATAQELQSRIEQAEKDLKVMYGQRNQYLDVLTPLVRRSRDLLSGVHSQNLRRLGEYGFDVVEAAAGKAGPAPTAKS
ncbi:hypothetical protein F0P96_14895 [Hymenobacter busanensis]|uniref:Uncharacterized protein n=1 Tax=Hymenobacter busanensis TaxID=2607656 RepID=A0A7L5A073_9BACT|nr:hypothetical protein [Hymenobacter busanensis]KAA9331523.1 hypothetical protein F0P96_14895 [Hymenobacter busanensis]QHJ08677.1 hypothetical protein GUY19_15830 [Hymenobacter busanensis]